MPNRELLARRTLLRRALWHWYGNGQLCAEEARGLHRAAEHFRRRACRAALRRWHVVALRTRLLKRMLRERRTKVQRLVLASLKRLVLERRYVRDRTCCPCTLERDRCLSADVQNLLRSRIFTGCAVAAGARPAVTPSRLRTTACGCWGAACPPGAACGVPTRARSRITTRTGQRRPRRTTATTCCAPPSPSGTGKCTSTACPRYAQRSPDDTSLHGPTLHMPTQKLQAVSRILSLIHAHMCRPRRSGGRRRRTDGGCCAAACRASDSSLSAAPPSATAWLAAYAGARCAQLLRLLHQLMSRRVLLVYPADENGNGAGGSRLGRC